jgi:S1-C subfamily serine protease
MRTVLFFGTLKPQSIGRSFMESALTSLSHELSQLVQQAGASVVAVHARRRFPSSGVHWGPDLVVTADHTITREEDLRVTLADGRTAEASLLGRAPGTDLAALKVPGLGEVHAIGAGNQPQHAKPVLGEFALIVGRSPDSGPNASLGIIGAVSGSWQTWRGGRLDQYIRLDAMLYPNSSGGLVVNACGEFLGIATSALSRVAGLAIPATDVARVARELHETGYVAQGYLGIGVYPVALPENLKSKLSLKSDTGILILNVEKASPAESAGMLLGDLLVSLNSTPIEKIEDLQFFCASGVIGKPVTARLIRAGAPIELSVTVGQRPQKAR